MTRFKLNIPDVNYAIEKYKNVKKECMDDISSVYGGMSYVESSWNDLNTASFVSKVKKDKYNIQNYFNYLDDIYDEIDLFKGNLDYILHKKGYKENSVYFKFNDYNIAYCKAHLNLIINSMNSSLNYINTNSFGSDFQDINLIYTLRSEIISIKKLTNELIDIIQKFVSQVNNELSESRTRLKRKTGYNLKLELSDYNWKLSDLSVKQIEDSKVEYINNINSKRVNFEIPKDMEKVKSNVVSSIANTSDINLEESKKIENINKNVAVSFANQTDINYESKQDLSNLSENKIDYDSSIQKMNLEDSSTILGLNNNVKNAYINDTTFNFSSKERVDTLNEDLETYGFQNSSVNFNLDNNINLKKIENDYQTQTINMDFNSNNETKLNNNIASYEASNTTINSPVEQNMDINVNTYSTTERKFDDFV